MSRGPEERAVGRRPSVAGRGAAGQSGSCGRDRSGTGCSLGSAERSAERLEWAALGELRLEARDFAGPGRWRWVLTGPGGTFLADHEVRLDTRCWQFEAFSSLRTPKMPARSPGSRRHLAAGLPAANPLGAASTGLARVAWWDLGRDHQYLWNHLIEHLLEAGRHSEAEAVVCDPRWAGARLQEFGPAAPAADRSRAVTPRAARLQAVVARTAHLLAPTRPAGAVVDVLHSRVVGDPDWGAQVTALRHLALSPGWSTCWPLPDLPEPVLRRVLTGRHGWVYAVAIAPDGTWLATGGLDGTARIWEAATGQERALMRVENVILACAWLGTRGLAAGGRAGLYLFDFLAGTILPSARCSHG